MPKPTLDALRRALATFTQSHTTAFIDADEMEVYSWEEWDEEDGDKIVAVYTTFTSEEYFAVIQAIRNELWRRRQKGGDND